MICKIHSLRSIKGAGWHSIKIIFKLHQVMQWQRKTDHIVTGGITDNDMGTVTWDECLT